MFKVIEISDSEDEQEQQHPTSGTGADLLPLPQLFMLPEAIKLSTPVVSAPSVEETSSSPPPMVIAHVTSINMSPLPSIVAVHSSPGGAASAAVGTVNAGTVQQSKRSRRKSMHHPICVSPEIQFEMIALDGDEDYRSIESKRKDSVISADANQQNKSPKSHKTTPKILNAKPNTVTLENQLSDACTELLVADRTNSLLRQIAEDRVRINFLLASYNMPEIQFSLQTQLPVLQFQLEERIKNRRMRSLETAWQQKKRRSLKLSNAKANH